MRRDNLGLADDSLFIEIIDNAFTAADTFLLIGAHGFSKERAFKFDSTPFQAIDQPPDHDAELLAITASLLASPNSQELFKPGEVRKQFCWNITAAPEDRSSPFITRIEKPGFIDATQRKQEKQL